MTKYVIARNFNVAGDQTLQYGEVAPPEIEQSPNLAALVSSHYLYPLPDEGDGGWLPPHLYSQVANVQMKRGFIQEGEQPNMGINWTKPPQVERVEELIDAQAESIELNKLVAENRAQQRIENERVFRLSPRPVELPPEKVLVDSKHDEAMSTGVEHITVPEEVEYDEGDDAVETVAEEEQAVGGTDTDEDDDDSNHYTKADLQELVRGWNDDHPDDKVSPNQNKAELEAALSERGVI